MLDLKAIRQQPEDFKTRLARKGVPANVVNDLLSADEVKRDLQAQTESLKAEQNEASKRIPQLSGSEKEEALAAMKTIAGTRKNLEADLEKASAIVDELMLSLPNPPRAEVPDGKSDEENVVARFEGQKPEFSFKPKEHWELAEALNLLDMEQAAKVSGSRFYYLKNELALLQQALMMWAFREVADKGYSPTIPPFMTRKEAIMGTGFFDRDENYCVNPGEDDLYLIGTSEVPMVSIHADQIIDLSNGPLRYAAYSPCFRREAGSYGKDTKGILRVHQFEKIEMVVFCAPEDAVAVHESLRETEEEILKKLGIHYQVVDICCGDLGVSASKKYDLEAWLPGQAQYREMTSTSICDDFQTRRLNIRYKDADGNLQFAHALNGTAVSSRPLIAILENGQKEDGSIDIPEVLWPYTGFERIEAK
ncbi:serine--tRNA ligase [bacterium]|nr:serine--tRNA ligase [bacterium]NCQ55463.1 serine--tRNA ligase [Candidatus Parcubacteria bacterium]NCS67825.1 serine--tRNA ligase [Candidatus Peregrinibacteria bacterium]NCS96361.1 serine--tRNA ligase [bacterium]